VNKRLTIIQERFRVATRALRYRNFRLFFMGQSISLVGTWMQRIALGWLVYRLTNSAFLLGMVGFVGQLPIFLITPFAGVLADRLNRHQMVIVTQVVAMLQALVLAVLVLNNRILIWQVLVLSAILGLVNAVDMPTRQSFMIEMIDKREDLGNAIAMNSSMVNAARLLGPSLAGLMIAEVGEGICFLLNGLSYITVISALFLMHLPPPPTRIQKNKPWQDLITGFRYAFSFPPIRTILLLLSLVSLVGMPYTILMPVFAKSILKGGPNTLGFLMAAAGVGALVGALVLASRRSVLGLGKWMVVSIVFLGTGLITFSFSRTILPSLFFMLFTGFGMISLMAAGNTVLQTIADDDKRGRVMSFYTVAIMGMTPFGSLLYGLLAEHIGAPATLIIGGTLCIIGALAFSHRLPSLRLLVQPIYVKKGVIPEIAGGLQSAGGVNQHNKSVD
jgi:MFS family permease